MNIIKSEAFYNLIVVLLALGVFSTLRPIMVAALVLWLVRGFVTKDWPDLNDIWHERLVKGTCFFAALYFGFLLLDNLLLMDKPGFKVTVHYIERTLPGILCLLMLFKRKEKLKYVFLGMALGIAFISHSAIHGVLVYNFKRAHSWLGNTNNLGGWIVVTLPFFVALLYELRKKYLFLAIGTVVLVMQIVSLYLSYSRGAMLAVLVAALVAVFLYMPKKYKIGLVAVFMLSVVSVLGMGVHKNFFTSANEDNFNILSHGKSDMERIYLLQSGVNMFMDHKLLGVGNKNYSSEYVNNYKHPKAINDELSSPHNIFLHYLDYYGIVGSMGLVAMLAALFKKQLSWLHNDFRYNHIVLGMFLTSVGFFVHAQLDCLHLTNFIMQIMWYLWALTCCYVMNTGSKGC